VYEKNPGPGGKADQLTIDGFRFDTGPSLLTMPFVINVLFNYADTNPESYISVKPLKTLCKYFFPDGTIIKGLAKVDLLAEEIASKTADSPDSVKQFFEYSKTIYDLTADLFLFREFGKVSTFLNSSAFKALMNLKKIDTGRTMHEANASFFKDAKTLQIFDRYATYNGSSPFKAPATLNIIQHVEYNLGGYFVEGGMYSLVKGFHDAAAAKGANIVFNTEVEKIIVKKNKAKGILVDGGEHSYDAVISNADSLYTYRNLLHGASVKEQHKYEALEPSSSAFVIFLGMRSTYPLLNTHNIVFAESYEKEFDELFERRVYPDDPTVYIYISSKESPDDAPAGRENWFVMINAPFAKEALTTEEIEDIKKNIYKKIYDNLGISVPDEALFEKVMTPNDIQEKTNSIYGSIYGISSNDKKAAFRRQTNRSKSIRRLYFCGGSAHPGGGIPLVTLSGMHAAKAVIEDL
jgi:phytoene desaturase